jgi:hypothetical protein
MGSDPLGVACRSESSHSISPKVLAPSFKNFAQLEEMVNSMKTLNRMMRRGALVIANTSEVKPLPDPMSTSFHELFSHGQCALTL